ncbi:PREDICTED: venom carboxylesterase-6-like [Eufriesea mexicana]|uniref:venom carboxylesterase-6-like n=1 Tax=Eufriesea mexicana TaxID=516756 RepID=UPI00083BDD83|nr:PREDICTED: venom carboxylesterase-6-like [Eufriesea mexicana]
MCAMKLSTVLLLLGFLDFSSQHDQYPRASTIMGTIRGYHKISRHGRKYEAFEGIPYAQPPVGKLRFQPPKRARKWLDELPATKKGSVCTQYLAEGAAINGDSVTGSEDCLYLNIYVPIGNRSNNLLPVLFWIHCGGFLTGSGNHMNESLIMDYNVVLVTINYRLGPFGFLSTGDGVVPGNMGLKDQSLALHWVSQNIEEFGGDPKRITLMGFSAGAASVHYHYLTPLSAGLFHRGISISGVALNPWAQTDRAPEKTRKLAAFVGCSTSRVKKMVKCLQTRPAGLLSQAVNDFTVWLTNPSVSFGPVVEEDGPHAFISRSPIDVINRGEAYDVPWISGVVSEEGLYGATEFITNNTRLKQLNDNWADIAPYLLDYNDTIPLNQQTQVSQKIKERYLGSEPIDSKSVTPVIHMMRDRMFIVNFEKAARLQARNNKSPVWTYYYSYRTMYSLSEATSHSTNNFGVGHGDDVYLVIDTRSSDVTQPQDVEMQQRLLDFYTSYAIEG